MSLSAALACRALREARCLRVSYDNFERVVEVHVVGRSGEGRHNMRVWQVRGGSASGETAGWKMLHLGEVRSGRLTDEPALAPRPGYKRDDPAMKGGIVCQL